MGQRDSRQGQSESFWENEPNPRFWQNEPNQGELAERTQFPPVSPSHRDTRGMTSFHVPLPRGWNAERTRQLIAVYRFSRSSGESFVVPAGAGVDRFPGGGPFVRLPSLGGGTISWTKQDALRKLLGGERPRRCKNRGGRSNRFALREISRDRALPAIRPLPLAGRVPLIGTILPGPGALL